MDAARDRMILYNKTALCFDDILIVPQESDVESRHKVYLTMSIGSGNRSVTLGLPIIAAPMDTVCDFEMCIVMSNAGGLGILHRYMPRNNLIEKTKTLADAQYKFGVSVGATNGYMNDVEDLYNAGSRIILVDIANGHSHYALNAVKNIRRSLPDDLHIMAGNVATAEGFARLAEAGADSVRVGIGGGSACTTRIVSGHGVPTLASIMDIDEWRELSNEYDCSIVADGGIRNSGDMVKSFAAGAEAVMVGSMFAGTDESPGEILTDANGHEVKMFRGMASAAAQNDAQGRVSVAEGISTTIPYKGSMKHILDSVRGGLGSGCSYSGVSELSELSSIAEYVEVASTSLQESRPHAL
jgi:IMP dehydrogenase/GMP reductase